MPELKDKYLEPLEGEPEALNEKVEISEDDFVKETPVEIPVSEKEPIQEKEPQKEIIEEKEIKPEPVIEEKKEEETVQQNSDLSSKIKDQIKRIKQLDNDSQVKEICNLVFLENLDFAVEVAKGVDNAYVLDEFHDTLVDELYDKLIKEGNLKKF